MDNKLDKIYELKNELDHRIFLIQIEVKRI